MQLKLTTRQSNRGLLFSRVFVGLLFLAIAILSLWFIGTNLISNDGAQYLSTAVNIAGGNGISTSVLYFDQHFHSGRLPSPQAMWPPAFPLFLSLFSSFVENFDYFCVVLNLLLHGLSGWLIYRLLIRIGASANVSLLTLSVFLLTTQGWTSALELRSEPLFAAILLIGMHLLPNQTDRRRAMWFWVGVTIGLAFSVRYVAILMLAAALFTLLLESLKSLIAADRARFFRIFVNGCLLSLGALLVIVPTLIRNHRVSGSLLPRSGSDAGMNVIQLLDLYLETLVSFLGFSGTGVLADGVRYVLFILLIFSLFVLFVQQTLARHRRPNATPVIMYSLWCTVFSLAFFSWTGLSTSTTTINARYLSIIVLTAIPVLCWVGFCGQFRGEVSRVSITPSLWRALPVVVAVVFLLGQANAALSNRHLIHHQNNIARLLSQQSSDGLSLREVALRCATDGRSLLSNQAQQTHRLLKVPTVGVAQSFYTSGQFDVDNASKLIQQYRISLIILHTRDFRFRWPIDADARARLTQVADHFAKDARFTTIFSDGNTFVLRNAKLCTTKEFK